MEAESSDVLVLAPKHARNNVDGHGGQRWTICGVIYLDLIFLKLTANHIVFTFVMK